MQKSDQKSPVFFVKMSAEFHWPCCETSICALPSSSQEVVSSSPKLLKQLVELEFFSDDGGLLSDGITSRPPSEFEQTLGNTLVQAPSDQSIQQPITNSDHATETPTFIVPDDRLVDGCKTTNADRSLFSQTREIRQMYNKADGRSLVADDEMMSGDADRNIYTCGSSPTDVSSGAVSDSDRPTSTLSSAVSFEHSSSDIDSESYHLMAESELVDGLTDGFCSALALFAGSVLQSRLLSTVALMNTIHRRCLETMISVAFDMAWDVICTPTRIKFARSKEVIKLLLVRAVQFLQF